MTIRRLNFTDRLLRSCQQGVEIMTLSNQASRPYPAGKADPVSDPDIPHKSRARGTPAQRQSGALMRVNHVGEVCAQALYQGQALMARDARVRAQFEQAALEEKDHLAWTAQRLRELNAHRSFLTPLWFTGSLLIGTLAGRASDRASLGFMAETERQVEQHLASHLEHLPADDSRSRQIVAQMKQDEAGHASAAIRLGAISPPWFVRGVMRMAARVMTTVAYRV